MPYPSLYRAKAVQYDGTTLTAYVPQVFGDVTIQITDLIGDVEPGMGWVLFQAGNPEFPVWMSGVSVTNVFGPGEGGDDSASIFITRDYRWVNQVTATDPGHGKVKVNNLDPALATAVYLSLYDDSDTAYLTALSLTTGDLIAVYLSGDVNTRIEYTLTGPIVNNGGGQWATIPVSLGANHGFASGTPGNNAAVKVTIETTGSAPSAPVVVPDEVWVSPTAPTDAAVELWYDSDAPTPSAVDRWNSTWGIIAMGSFIAPLAPHVVSVTGALTNPVTATLITGRRYRIYLQCRAVTPTGAATAVSFYLRDNGVEIRGWQYGGDPYVYAAGNYSTASFEWLYNGDNTQHSFEVIVAPGSGVNVFTDYGLWYIEDVGPISYGLPPAVDPTPTAVAWTPMSLTTGWTSLGGTVGYRKVGDEVMMRGVIQFNAVINALAQSTVGNLPVGFRPTTAVGHISVGSVSLQGVSGGGSGACQWSVGPNGNVVYQHFLNNAQPLIVSLDNIRFSVMP